MNRMRIAVCAVAAVVLGTAAAVAATTTASKDVFRFCLKIVAFGSSSTQGVGASSQDASYPAQVAREMREQMPKGQSITVVNAGIGGEDATDMMKRLQTDVIDRHPGLVIWQTGSNDSMTKNPVAHFEQQTREGIRLMRAAGIEVILLEPQWAPYLAKVPHSADYTEAVRRIGAEMHVTVIRRTDIMKNWVEMHTFKIEDITSPDGLHANDRGYKEIAHCVAKEVMNTDAYKKLPMPDKTAPTSTPAATRL